MNSGIKYCSLEEAWGPVYSGRYNDGISYNGAMVPLDNVQTMTVDEFEGYTRPQSDDIRDFMQEEEKPAKKERFHPSTELAKCTSLIDHFYECEKCQELILRRCKQKLKKRKNIMEGFMNLDDGDNDNNYTDIAVILLVGVFIILVLDSILRLGRRMA